MPTCNAKKSSAPLHSNYWENYGHDSRYDGYYRFNQDQFYDGEFFRGSMHGQGTYKWKNLAVYEGGFYSNFKEGYASLSFSDNSYFEGLFIKNQPFGPGILTHANGRQDAGFWVGRKLVRLSRAVDFIIPRLAPTSAAKIKLLQFRRLIPLNEDNCDSAIDILKKTGCLAEPVCTPYSSLIYDPRSIFFEKEVFEKTYFISINKLSKEFLGNSTEWEKSIRYNGENAEEEEEELKSPISQVPSHCLCPQDVFMMDYKISGDTDICDRESYKGEYEMGILAYFTRYGTIEGFENRMDDVKNDLEIFNGNFTKDKAEATTSDNSKDPKIVSWNRSELCTEMIKQIFRYRAFEGKLNFNLGKLMLGARTAFRRTGEKEKQCLQFLKMCSIGPPHVIKDLLCNYEINEELMDARGNNSLMFAAAADQHEIMDILLDYGVDVNTFNDESLTPLNLCLLRRLAQTNGICNWETAFLPKEIDKTMISESFTQMEGLDYLQSIPSLDRIFGDGMSISNSKSSASYKRLTTFPSPTSFKNTKESSFHKSLDESKHFLSLSQITLFKISESQGNHSLILPSSECKTQKYQKCTGISAFQGSGEPIQTMGSIESTPQINIRIVPKSNKREEFEKSIQQSATDKYLFEFSFEKKPNGGGNQGKPVSVKSSKGKASKPQKEETKKDVEVEKALDLELTKKIAEIDKTIEKLLKRGANPNISEVPKPSIHLGVYTKDINTVYTLLLHGANPDSQLYSNEGLLTPLHVIVLQKSAQEYTDICDLLLKFGANPEEETNPEFSLCEEEKEFLTPEQGRTPLQLLCMRPDLEYVNPIDNLIKIGLMLAKVSDKRHFYKGHSCLTLAMHSNNLKLLKALLNSKYFDPNEILEEDRGTALHFLVSTELQKRTIYETSIKICDLLIAGGANPLKKFKSPKKLIGTCVDYGYREIEAEKEKRKLNISEKKSEKTGKEKTGARDYLKDHERVIEYLGTIALNTAKKEFSKHNIALGKKEHQDSFKNGLTTIQKAAEKNEKSAKSSKVKVESKENVQNTGEKDKRQEKTQKNDDLKNNINKKDNFELEKDKKRKKFEEEEKKDDAKKAKKEKDENANDKKDLGEIKGSKKKAGKGSEKEQQPREKRKVKDDEKVASKKYLEKGTRKTESNLVKLTKSSTKNLSLKKLGTRSETFPEKLRQTLLRIYGTCANIDINEFLVPYVVLRNGDLYYRFQGKVDRKEQYSLI